MRLYLIHRKYYLAYLTAQQNFEAILNEHEILFQKVQPKSALAEHEREFMVSNPISGTNISRKAEDYVIEVEQHQIRTRLKEAREVLESRKLLLNMKEEELRKSKDIYNVVYVKKYIDNKKIGEIILDTGYSRSQIYSIIKQLERQLERS